MASTEVNAAAPDATPSTGASKNKLSIDTSKLVQIAVTYHDLDLILHDIVGRVNELSEQQEADRNALEKRLDATPNASDLSNLKEQLKNVESAATSKEPPASAADVNALKAKMESLEDKMRDKDSEIDGLRKKLSALEALRDRDAEKEKELADVRDFAKGLEGQLTKDGKDYDGRLKKIEEVQLPRLDKALAALGTSVDDLDGRTTKAVADIEERKLDKKDFDRLADQVKELTSKADGLAGKLAAMEGLLSMMGPQKGVNDEAVSQISSFSDTIQKILARLADHDAALSDSNKRIDDNKDGIEATKKQLPPLGERIDAANTESVKRDDDLRNELRQLGLAQRPEAQVTPLQAAPATNEEISRLADAVSKLTARQEEVPPNIGSEVAALKAKMGRLDVVATPRVGCRERRRGACGKRNSLPPQILLSSKQQ